MNVYNILISSIVTEHYKAPEKIGKIGFRRIHLICGALPIINLIVSFANLAFKGLISLFPKCSTSSYAEFIKKAHFHELCFDPVRSALKFANLFKESEVLSNPKEAFHRCPALREDRQFLLELITKEKGRVLDDQLICQSIEHFSNDKDFFKKILNENGDLIELASTDLKDDLELARLATKFHKWNYRFLGPDARKDPSLAINVLKKDPEMFKYIDKELRSHKDVMLVAIRYAPHAYYLASDSLKQDQDFNAHAKAMHPTANFF
jgi:Domain of unknown function (DUF4116)